MSLFPYGHATHPQWRMAASLVLAQLRAQMARPEYARQPTLGLLYITDHYARDAQDLLDFFSGELPEVPDWAGTVGIGVAANNAEYFDEPGLALMLCELPSDQYRVFSGVSPLGMAFEAQTALVHADASTPELTDLIPELAGRTDSGYVFGGLAASRYGSVQFALSGNGNVKGQGAARGVFTGGLSGVAFGPEVGLVSRVTQGCLPVASVHDITASDGHVALTLDGEPALDVLLRDLNITLDLRKPQAPQGAPMQQAIEAVRSTLVGLGPAGESSVGRTGHFGEDVLVRHLIGLDPLRRAVAVAHPLEAGMRLTFCRRNAQAARADLMRICAEIREELEPEMLEPNLAEALAGQHPDAAPHPARRIAGAVYVSCSGRGGPHFGGPSAELQIVRHALGDVPLVGFFAGGEIAHQHLYGYTGVLTVFTAPA